MFERCLILVFIFMLLNSCGINGLAREQIKNENSILKEPIYIEAYKLYYEKKYLQAYNIIYEYIFNKKGSSLILHSLIVYCASKLNNIDELFKSYQKIEEQKYYLFARGVLLIIEERRKDECIDLFKEILKFFPENPIVQMYLGYLYIVNNKPYLAQDILNKSTENLSNYPFNKYFLAMANYFANNKEKALENINDSIKLFPSFMKEEIESAEKFKKKLLDNQ